MGTVPCAVIAAVGDCRNVASGPIPDGVIDLRGQRGRIALEPAVGDRHVAADERLVGDPDSCGSVDPPVKPRFWSASRSICEMSTLRALTVSAVSGCDDVVRTPLRRSSGPRSRASGSAPRCDRWLASAAALPGAVRHSIAGAHREEGSEPPDGRVEDDVAARNNLPILLLCRGIEVELRIRACRRRLRSARALRPSRMSPTQSTARVPSQHPDPCGHGVCEFASSALMSFQPRPAVHPPGRLE